MDVPVLNMQGQEVGTLSVEESSLGGVLNPALIKQAYVRYHANMRQGSARTLNRHEVEGSTRKLYKQKGTGRARHGDRKVPHFRGGGHAFAKRRTRGDFHLDMPKKMRRKANRNALLAKLLDNEVRIIDRIDLGEAKTRRFADFLGAIGVDNSALVALPGDAKNARLSARNLSEVSLCHPAHLNCFNMLNHRFLVIARADLETWLSGPWAQTDKEAKTNPLGRAAAAGEEAA